MSELGLENFRVSEGTLAALLEASTIINSTLDLQTVLQEIAQSAADVLKAEATSVLLLDAGRSKLIFRAVVGPQGDSLLDEEFDAKLGIAGKVVSSGQSILVPDVQHDPAFFGGIDEKSQFITRSMIAAPLLYRRQVLGVVEGMNKRGGASFSQQDVEVLRLFANLAAIGVANAQAHELVVRENRGLRETVARSTPEIVGKSPSLTEVLHLCDRVAATNATVLLLGETGTGKEVTARHIHAASARRNKAFIAINCAALPETLLESELFGHEAGAFTGATSTKAGRFELADGGTLFLDEIGDISLSTQIKLLRVLQERDFVRVGGTKTIKCDVRIIAATNRDLKKAIEAGDFREDLYYRLNVFPIHVPPLRMRREDIPALLEHYVGRTARDLGWVAPQLMPDAVEALTAYHWPGNIRELRNVVERAVLLCDDGRITKATLPREIVGTASAATAAAPVEEGGSALEGYEKAMIIRSLEEHDWNQTRTAAALNISRDNLRYRLRKYGIKRPEDGGWN